MRVELDENLPLGIASKLKTLGHDVHTAHAEGLSGRVDREIWEAAQREERFLITQDLDFSDVRRFAPGTHHGIVLIRLRRPGGYRLQATPDKIRCHDREVSGRPQSHLEGGATS